MSSHPAVGRIGRWQSKVLRLWRSVSFSLHGSEHYTSIVIQTFDIKKFSYWLCLFAITGLAAYVHGRWVVEYRFGQLLDIDEAGYLSAALTHARALADSGIPSWLRSLSMPTQHGPLVPAFASILMNAFGQTENVGLVTNIAFAALVYVVIFKLAYELRGLQVAIVTAMVVATIPMLTDHARNFYYAMASAFFFTLAVFAYYKSNAFHRLGWSLAFGAALGGMALSRTMTVAFLPSFAVAALVHTFMDGRPTKGQIGKAAGSILAFAIVALPWYAKSYPHVADYLVAFGYGESASAYGPDLGFATVSNLKSRLATWMLALHPIHFFIIAAGLTVWLARETSRGSRFARTSSRRFLMFGSLLCGLCVLTLATSRNRGNGFEVPILPTLTLVAVVSILESFSGRTRQIIGTMMIILTAIVGYSKYDLTSCDNLPRTMTIPFLGTASAFDCRGTIHHYVDGGGIISKGAERISSPSPLSSSEISAWRNTSIELADAISQRNGQKKLVAYASRHFLLNINTVAIEQTKRFGQAWPAIQIEPTVVPASTEGYRAWLKTELKISPCFVVMLTDGDGEFEPKPDIGKMRDALYLENYGAVTSIPTRTARQNVELWEKIDLLCR